MKTVENLAGYKFVTLNKKTIETSLELIKTTARNLGVKGSIILAEEGCNMFIAADPKTNKNFLEFFYKTIPELKEIPFKVSWSDEQPFKRMLVKFKKEIITFGQNVDAINNLVPEISPEDLSKNYSEYLIIDTRNNYETKLGKFANCQDLDLSSFKEFPKKIQSALPPEEIDKPIVIYCTGGIRCEKAGLWMQEAGYKNVFQLKDGILGYFEKCGNKNYEGECFVFDKRVGVDEKLDETETKQCFECRTPWSQNELSTRQGICSCGNQVQKYHDII